MHNLDAMLDRLVGGTPGVGDVRLLLERDTNSRRTKPLSQVEVRRDIGQRAWPFFVVVNRVKVAGDHAHSQAGFSQATGYFINNF